MKLARILLLTTLIPLLYLTAKISSVFLVGIFIGSSDSAMKKIIYADSVLMALGLLSILIIYQKTKWIKSIGELIFIYTIGIVITFAFVFFNYLPSFGIG